MGKSFIINAHIPQNICVQHVLTESGAQKWNVSVRALKITPKLNRYKVYRRESPEYGNGKRVLPVKL